MSPDHGTPAGIPRLHGYWRSTAAFRVRIALNLKNIAWEHAPVHLVRNGGEQHGPAYRALNPAGLVPTLVWDDVVLSQSLAICEYLEEVQPEPALLPEHAPDRAWVRALALDIACDVHPLNNLRVLQYLGGHLGQSEEVRTDWMHHWMHRGFSAVEQRLAARNCGTEFCFGSSPGLADIMVVAQAYNADRFAFSLDPFPQVTGIVATCRSLEAFRAAAPELQPDAS